MLEGDLETYQKIFTEIIPFKVRNFHFLFLLLLLLLFCIRVFFYGHWRLTGQQWKGGDHFLMHSTTSTRSRTLRHLFATLQVRWLSHIFNRNTCISQTATHGDFPTLSNYHLIDWWCKVCFSLFTCWFDTRFCYSNLDTGNQWTRTRIDYHPGITSKPTNQMC